LSDEITPPRGSWPEDDPLSFIDDETPEPRSLLGLPVRLLLALGGILLSLLAVAWFAATHDWPPPPPCGPFAVFGCPTAPYPVAVQWVDWLDLAGPLIGLGAVIGAVVMRKDPAEGGILWILLVRFALPVVGLFVAVGCAVQQSLWISH
jgi:hypothetical protein